MKWYTAFRPCGMGGLSKPPRSVRTIWIVLPASIEYEAKDLSSLRLFPLEGKRFCDKSGIENGGRSKMVGDRVSSSVIKKQQEVVIGFVVDKIR